MYRFRHLIVIDFDELVLPRSASTLADLVADIEKSFSKRANAPVNYIFWNNYYFLDSVPDTDMSPYFTFLRYRRKVPLSDYGIAVKSIIDPQACVHMHNHYCWGVTPGYQSRNAIELIDPKLAVNQHYKICHLNETECEHVLENTQIDDTILRYRSRLRSSFSEKVHAIAGHNI